MARGSAAAAFRTLGIHLQSGRLNSVRETVRLLRGTWLALSTYLGHAHVSDTYWYLQATPKLLGDVAAAAEALHRGGER